MSIGCAPELSEEAEELACLRVEAAETCLPSNEVEIDLENQRLVFPNGWIAIYDVADSREERNAVELGKLAELREMYPDGPDFYMGWGVRIYWTYDLYYVEDGAGLFVLIGSAWSENEDQTQTRYFLFWSFWRDLDRRRFLDQIERFVEATTIVDWD
jgi:hypothetical protein